LKSLERGTRAAAVGGWSDMEGFLALARW